MAPETARKIAEQLVSLDIYEAEAIINNIHYWERELINGNTDDCVALLKYFIKDGRVGAHEIMKIIKKERC